MMADIEDLEQRVLLLEKAVFELSLMAKYLKIGVLVFLASVGIDVGAMV